MLFKNDRKYESISLLLLVSFVTFHSQSITGWLQQENVVVIVRKGLTCFFLSKISCSWKKVSDTYQDDTIYDYKDFGKTKQDSYFVNWPVG